MVGWIDGWMGGREKRRQEASKDRREEGGKQAREGARERPRTTERLERLCGDPCFGLGSDETTRFISKQGKRK